eukprot:Skav207884  [mRNA]  locus=scaffold664:543979:548393:- [translate_table: standard]
MLTIFTLCCSLGEASNPGPVQGDLLLGAANPNGLLGKGHIVSKLPSAAQTIWAISETHHTKAGANKFADELKMKRSRFQAQFGHPVQAKSRAITAIGGKHSGVGFVTDRPCRHLAATWSDPSFEPKVEGTDLSRLHAMCFQCGPRQIHGGVIYGHSHNLHTLPVQQQTDDLCKAIHARIVDNTRGLRFIAGDLNQDHDALPSMRMWADSGWVNVQKWAADVLGKPMRPTSQGRTIRDHIFVSPELAPYLLDVDVQEDWFSDHAILFATFTSIGKPPMIPMWRIPSQLPWADIPVLPDETQHSHVSQGTPNQKYQQIWSNLEERVVQVAPKGLVNPSQLGRATTYEVKLVQEYTSTPKIGRKGDPQPQTFHPDEFHTQQLRQLRRLASLTRLLAISDRTVSQQEHLVGTWKKIMNAPGFAPTFPQWWTARQLAPEWPAQLPLEHEAKQLLHSFDKQFRNWEKAMLQARTSKAKARRTDDPNVIFRDLKGPAPKPVQMLLDTHVSQVVDLDPVDQAVVVHPPCCWSDQLKVKIGSQSHDIIHAEPDKLWLSTPATCAVGATVRQEQAIGDLPGIFARFKAEWNQRWEKHVSKPPSVLLVRLHSIAWGWGPRGFHDEYGEPCDLLGGPIQEITMRVKRAWQQHVQGVTSSRKTMTGLPQVLPQITMAKVKQQPPEAQAILRASLNGTFFTADHLKHTRPEDAAIPSGECPFCGRPDSQIHRHWHCEHFSDLRPFTTEQLEELQDFPSSFLAHGWMPEPPTLQVFRSRCQQIPDEHLEWCIPHRMPRDTLHLFTDGGCEAPTSPYAKLATWGVVLADVDHDMSTALANGLVPGWLQTALRGEITAVSSAIAFAVWSRRPFVLWVDNDVVVKRIRALAKPKAWIKPNQKDSDLWARVLGYLRQAGSLMLGVCKVVSHQDRCKARDEVEDWVFRNNAFADSVAAQALGRHTEVHKLSQQLQREVSQLHIVREQIHTMYLDIGRRAIANKKRPSDQPVQADQQMPTCFQDWEPLTIPQFEP